MCKAPKPPKPKEPKKPQFLRNRYLDEFVGDAQAVKSLKSGRNVLRIPLGGPAPSATDSLPTPVQPTSAPNAPTGVTPIGVRNPKGQLIDPTR